MSETNTIGGEDRIAYGEETAKELPNGEPLYIPRLSENCHDCQAERGEMHIIGCDVEQCPICKTQLLSCNHGHE